MNYYPRHIGDYLTATAHLSLLEHGVYARLLDVYYTREAPIPDGQAERLCGARTPEEKEAVRVVLEEFFELVDGEWRQARCDDEIGRFRKKCAAIEALRSRLEYRQHREYVLQRDGMACVYCGTTEAALQLDHVIPKSRGGSDDPSNLVAACKRCNTSKGAKTPEEWRGHA